MSNEILMHATCVALADRAVLLCGTSGAGKSDLALRLIDKGWTLVSDDQTRLRRGDGQILASAPSSIAGLIEVRGVGLVKVPCLAEAPLTLLVDLVAPESIERLPQPRTRSLLDVDLPAISLAPFEASAPAKLGWALAILAAPS